MTEERVLLHSASLKAITLYHEDNTLNDIHFQPAQLKAPNHGAFALGGTGRSDISLFLIWFVDCCA